MPTSCRLGGIAIAIGAMIDAAIVMIENMHKHLERAVDAKLRAAGAADARRVLRHQRADHRGAVARSSCDSAREVGPALFFSLLIITVSFLPVFTLEGQEGRLFKPLAYTKTFAMAAREPALGHARARSRWGSSSGAACAGSAPTPSTGG